MGYRLGTITDERVRWSCQPVMFLTFLQFSPVPEKPDATRCPQFPDDGHFPLNLSLHSLQLCWRDLLSGNWCSWHLLPQDNSQHPAAPLSLLQWLLVKDSAILKKTSVIKISDFLAKGSKDSIRGGDYWIDRSSGCCGKIYLQHCGKRYGQSQQEWGDTWAALPSF